MSIRTGDNDCPDCIQECIRFNMDNALCPVHEIEQLEWIVESTQNRIEMLKKKIKEKNYAKRE